MKDIAYQIEENDDEGYMAYMLGISFEELKQLVYSSHLSHNGFSRTVVLDIEKCPKDIVAKIKDLTNGNTVTYNLFDWDKIR